jgi:hypothetical protein
VLEVVVGEEIELVEEISNIDTAEWVHLGEGEDAGEAMSLLASLLSRYSAAHHATYTSSSAGFSWANQLTFTTFSYSSSELIAIGL